jgi:geranylgeranyl diphosphate synthase type II
MSCGAERETFVSSLEQDRGLVEKRLELLLDELARGPSIIEEAVRYMVLDAGKRLRPVLCLWTHDAFGGNRRDACLDAACAIECLHTYSLVHDDLPCMDDDDLRRGKPSCHKKYGEAVAVLAGDALLTLCFDVLSSIGERWDVPAETVVSVTRLVSSAAGTGGLIGGQVLDVTSGGLDKDRGLVERIHVMKTAALIAASMESGAVLAGVPPFEREKVRRIGSWAGQAFQIVDDVLDVEASPGMLGKTPGKDARNAKLTYPSLVGLAASKEAATRLVAKAREDLVSAVGARGQLLASLLDFMVERRG